MKRLSIIIVTYKSENDIYDCLSSVWENCDLKHEELEIIVVDNSPDSTLMFSQLRERYGRNVMLIKNTHNGGYGQGNNVGIRQATAPVIMIMNPDVRLMEPILKTVVQAFEQDDSLCMYGIKQMLSTHKKSPLSYDCSYCMNGYLASLLTPICNRINFFIPKYMYFSGSCFFISKNKFEQVGLFDESIFMYGEEDDIHWRMKQHYGPQFVFNSKLHYIHLAKGHAPSLQTEKAMLKSIVSVNKKKGIPVEKTIHNRLRSIRVRNAWLSIRGWLGRKDQEQQVTLIELMNYMKHKI